MKNSKDNVDYLMDEIRDQVILTGQAVHIFDRMADGGCSLYDLWIQAIKIYKTAYKLGLTLDDFFEGGDGDLKAMKHAAEAETVLERVVAAKQRELDELKAKLAA